MENKIVLDFLEANDLSIKLDLFSKILKGLEVSFHVASARNMFFEKAFRDFNYLIIDYFKYWELYYEKIKTEKKKPNERLLRHLNELLELGNINNKWEELKKSNRVARAFIEFIEEHISPSMNNLETEFI